MVDVVRNSTVTLTPFSPDPTSDNTPTYFAVGGNTATTPGGTNSSGLTHSPVSIAKVESATWKLESTPYTAIGVVPTDGAFDEETGEHYTFTPQSPIANGLHTFRTRVKNNFGHSSGAVLDKVTMDAP